jgi:hypothetical protein
MLTSYHFMQKMHSPVAPLAPQSGSLGGGLYLLTSHQSSKKVLRQNRVEGVPICYVSLFTRLKNH